MRLWSWSAWGASMALETSHPLAPRMHVRWTRLSLGGRFAIAGWMLLGCAMCLFAGWANNRISQALIAVVILAMVGLLSVTVRRASDTIVGQQQITRDRIVELSRLLEQNEELRQRINEIHGRSVEINDLVLRRVGAELHDGPAQLIGLALLRLDSLRPKKTERDAEVPADDYERVRGALVESLAEIRNISAGLALPELARVSPAGALRLAARNHERRTGTTVTCEVDGLPSHMATPIKSCLYRFAQEALNNAYRHADGRGQRVSGACRDGMIEVEVTDTGPGFEPGSEILGHHLGLTGMHDRVAALGGTLEIASQPGAGTRLTTRFMMTDDGSTHGRG